MFILTLTQNVIGLVQFDVRTPVVRDGREKTIELDRIGWHQWADRTF